MTHQELKGAGYTRYEATRSSERTNSWLNNADALYQKKMWDGDDLAFFVSVYWYDFARYGQADGWQPEVQFNSHNSLPDAPFFSVTLHPWDGMTVSAMEGWFWLMYRELTCQPYEASVSAPVPATAPGKAAARAGAEGGTHNA